MQDPVFVRNAFRDIAGRYVLTNHVLSLGIDVLWRNKVAAMVASRNPKRVLDIATGSGDLAETIRGKCPDAHVVGGDFCQPMMEHARKRGLPDLIVADGMNLPFADGSFDAVTVGFGLRNMASYPDAAAEMARVLAPGGKLYVLDFSLPSFAPLRAAYRFYLHKIMPAIGGLITGKRGAYDYLSGSIEKFPSGQKMVDLLEGNGFRAAQGEQLSFGIAAIYDAEK